RAATSDLHARVDALFPRGLDTVDAYRRYLLGMHRFAVDYECATGALPRQSAWLAGDLAALSLPPLPAEGRCVPVAGHAARLGWHYVMAGSRLDARRLGFGPGRGGDFLARHAEGEDWNAVLAQLRGHGADDEARGAGAVAGARDAFTLVYTCFERSFDRIPMPLPEDCR